MRMKRILFYYYELTFVCLHLRRARFPCLITFKKLSSIHFAWILCLFSFHMYIYTISNAVISLRHNFQMSDNFVHIHSTQIPQVFTLSEEIFIIAHIVLSLVWHFMLAIFFSLLRIEFSDLHWERKAKKAEVSVLIFIIICSCFVSWVRQWNILDKKKRIL